MRTRKDIIFYTLLALWLISNASAYFISKEYGTFVSNSIFIGILLILVIFKRTNSKFENWLETEI